MADYSSLYRHPAGESAELFKYLGAGEDAHGNLIDEWDEIPITLDGCAFDPGSSAEPRRPGQDRVIVEPNLFAPYGTPAEPKDRIKVRGEIYQVEGEARDWRSPFTGTAYGTAIALRRVSG